MLFASDLDRTLIYSNKFIDTYTGDSQVIEEIDNEPISYMSTHAISLLTAISKRMLFVPTTTRSLVQYKRITVFQQIIKPRYAIVANGGMILKNNVIDIAWEEIIANKMSTIISPQQLIDQNKQFFESSQIKLAKACDGLFAYAVFHQKPDKIDSFEQLRERCAVEGYTVTLNGRKVYFIPFFMTKWEAVNYIMQQEKESILLASGDSILDEPLIANCDYGAIPMHGELCNYIKDKLQNNKNLRITKADGLNSSNELLEYMLEVSNNIA